MQLIQNVLACIFTIIGFVSIYNWLRSRRNDVLPYKYVYLKTLKVFTEAYFMLCLMVITVIVCYR